jgi:hypothetical protein
MGLVLYIMLAIYTLFLITFISSKDYTHDDKIAVIGALFLILCIRIVFFPFLDYLFLL